MDVKKEDATGEAQENGLINSNTIKNSNSGTQNFIDVFELFESFEKAESLLGSETQPSKDVQAYTNHYFENVEIQCVYNTNRVYSVIIDCKENGFSDDLKINGIDCNSTQSDWDSAFGELFYSDYDGEGNRLFGYEYETNGKTYYIEFTVPTDKPEKISIYYEDIEY